MERMRLVTRRTDIAESMDHHHGRAHGVAQLLRHFMTNHDLGVGDRRAPRHEHHASIVAETIALVKLGGGTNHAEAAMTIAKGVRHHPLHRRVRLPALHRGELHGARRRADPEHGTQQHLEGTASCPDNQIHPTDGARKTVPHSGTHVFNTNQQRHTERNGRHRERGGEDATAKRREGQTHQHHASAPTVAARLIVINSTVRENSGMSVWS